MGYVGLVALGIGLPLTSAAAGPAPSAAPTAPDAVCRAAFGERGPVNGPVVGEGPSGDPMSVTVAWDPSEWPTGLREIVTCLSVGGHALPALASTTVRPPNAGTVTVNFTLPAGDPGTLVCQESVLIGTGSTEGRTRPTNPVCFKLRAAEDTAAPSASGGRAPSGRTPPHARRDATPPAVMPPMTPAAPFPAARTWRGRRPPAAHRPTAHRPAGPAAPRTFPATAAAGPRELARRFPAGLLGTLPGGLTAPADVPGIGPGGPRLARNAETAPPAATAATLEAASAPARPSGASRFSAARSAARPSSAQVGSTFRARPFSSDGRPLSVAPAPTLPATGGAAVPALPRTGINDHIPLAGGGGLLAIGGAAIVLGEPRRRSRRLRRA
jgi:hypothetical protein